MTSWSVALSLLTTLTLTLLILTYGARARELGRSQAPEANWTVTKHDDQVVVVDPKGQRCSISIRDLRGVAIETNDSGPAGADIWWLMFGANDRVACAFPQGASGDKDVVDWLMSLPNFDYNEMITAMGSADNATFPVWRTSAP